MPHLVLHSRWTGRRTTLAVWPLVLCILSLTGCMHRIEVHPTPGQTASTTIPRSAQILVGDFAIQGADHMPGITLLEWTPRDFSRGVIDYFRQRGTFASVAADSADLTLTIAAKLSMDVRSGHYAYRVRLHADIASGATPVKSYVTDRSADGSRVRWVTNSDRDPIEAALQLALDDLAVAIETDRALYAGK
ncbi:MAG: hypothetical protein U0412_10020 [Nitrospira sp.]